MQLNPPTLALELVLLLHFKCYRGKASLGLTLIKATQWNCFAWYEVLEAKNSVREKCKNLFSTHLKTRGQGTRLCPLSPRHVRGMAGAAVTKGTFVHSKSLARGGHVRGAGWTSRSRAGALPVAVRLWPAVTFLSCNAIIFREWLHVTLLGVI